MSREPTPAERNAEIYQARQSGETLESIGQRHGLTRERVRQIIEHFAALQARNQGPYKGLPPRIAKALKGAGLNSLKEAQQMSELSLLSITDIGAATAREIKNWPSPP